MKELEEYIKNELELYCFLKNPTPKVHYLPNNIYILSQQMLVILIVLCVPGRKCIEN